MAILSGSVLYLIITIIETYYKFQIYKKNYYNLKEEYKDILNEQDLNLIFKNDKEYLYNKNNINKIVIVFSLLWLVLIIIGFIFIFLNYKSEYIKKIVDIIYTILNIIF